MERSDNVFLVYRYGAIVGLHDLVVCSRQQLIDGVLEYSRRTPITSVWYGSMELSDLGEKDEHEDDYHYWVSMSSKHRCRQQCMNSQERVQKSFLTKLGCQ